MSRVQGYECSTEEISVPIEGKRTKIVAEIQILDVVKKGRQLNVFDSFFAGNKESNCGVVCFQHCKDAALAIH